MIRITTPRDKTPEALYAWVIEFVQQLNADEVGLGGTGGAGAGGAPLGAALWWPLADPPSGYFALDGQLIPREVYPGLFGLYGTTFNLGGEDAALFRLPNATGRFPKAGAVGTGGLGTVAIAQENLPDIELAVTDPGHSHEVEVEPHTHTVTDPGHVHALTGIPLEEAGTYSYTLGGELAVASVQNAMTTDNVTTGISIDDAVVEATAASAPTGISVALGGGGVPLDFDPPWWGGIWIVRAE